MNGLAGKPVKYRKFDLYGLRPALILGIVEENLKNLKKVPTTLGFVLVVPLALINNK